MVACRYLSAFNKTAKIAKGARTQVLVPFVLYVSRPWPDYGNAFRGQSLPRLAE